MYCTVIAPKPYYFGNDSTRVQVVGLTCLSCRAVGTDHLSCSTNLGTAGTVRARAWLTITRRANQSVAIVTVQAPLAGQPRGGVQAVAHTWNRGEGNSYKDALTAPACARSEVCFLWLLFFEGFFLDTNEAEMVPFPPWPAECAVSLTTAAAAALYPALHSPRPQSSKKTFPTVHR